MYLPKYYNFDKYVLIANDTGNERTWSIYNAIPFDFIYAQWETID